MSDPRTYKIIGACMEVHKELGCGFLEAVYQDALEQEFIIQGIPYEREKLLPIFFKGIKLNSKYRSDFFCYGEIPVELKALSTLTGNDDAQIIHYLHATGTHIGLLFNFGEPSLVYKRFIN